MKTILTLLLLTISATMMAQTNIISLKSHAGEIAAIDKETDNFGEPPWKMNVDTVEFIQKGVIVEYGFLGHRDTLRSDYYEEYITDRLKDYYSPRCVFIGFKESKHKNYQQEKQTKKNGIGIVALLVVIALMLNFRKTKPLNSIFTSLLIVGAITFHSSSLSAQTNVISLKSHAGDIAHIQHEKDNFGNPPMSLYPEISQSETVTYFDEGKIIHYQLNRIGMPIYDTIFDPNITQELTPYLRNKFPSSTQFIGFKRPKLDAAKPYFDTIHKNGFSYWLFIFLGVTMFSFMVKKRFS